MYMPDIGPMKPTNLLWTTNLKLVLLRQNAAGKFFKQLLNVLSTFNNLIAEVIVYQ